MITRDLRARISKGVQRIPVIGPLITLWEIDSLIEAEPEERAEEAVGMVPYVGSLMLVGDLLEAAFGSLDDQLWSMTLAGEFERLIDAEALHRRETETLEGHLWSNLERSMEMYK